MTAEDVKALVREAFVTAGYPGDGELVRSAGDEPDEVVELFRGRSDWRRLTPEFVDRAGAASPSALSFFSDKAFRFYLPAYLIADLDRQLVYTDPLFYLYHGLDHASREKRVIVSGKNTVTWWEVQQDRFAGFTRDEAAAIVAYMRWRASDDALTAHERQSVQEALEDYWLEKSKTDGLGSPD
jgi:hypothetical protein